jgi:2Fe-2S ferredoxin
MVKITYVEASGVEHVIDATPGRSVMENAVKNNVPGIAADCGGVCACATCRVYVGEMWQTKVPEPSEMERSMIEYSGDTSPKVRLSCQMQVTPELDGLIVHMPERQHYL